MSTTFEETEYRAEQFEWEVPTGPATAREPRRFGRRHLGVVAVLLLTVVGFPLLATGAVAHTTFAAGDVAVTSNGGELRSLTVAPSGDVHYTGFEANATGVTIVVEAKLATDTAWETVHTESTTATGLEGTLSFALPTTDLLTATSLSQSDFRALDGQSSTTDVDVRLTVTFAGAGPNGGDVVTTATDTFTVTVTNTPAGAGIGGRANTGGN